MRTEQFDLLLKQALMLAAIEDTKVNCEAESPVSDMEFSPQYLRNRMRLLANPFRYAKQKIKPFWKKALRTVACLLLVCSFAFTTAMVTSSSARAAVKQWLTEWYETYIAYRFEGETEPEEMPQYEIGALPDGYTEIVRNIAPGYISIIYENTEGKQMIFTYTQMEQGGSITTELADTDVYDIAVNSCSGQFFLPKDPEQSSAVVWINEEKKLYFSLNVFGEMKAILHIAESVNLVK